MQLTRINLDEILNHVFINEISLDYTFNVVVISTTYITLRMKRNDST